MTNATTPNQMQDMLAKTRQAMKDNSMPEGMPDMSSLAENLNYACEAYEQLAKVYQDHLDQSQARIAEQSRVLRSLKDSAMSAGAELSHIMDLNEILVDYIKMKKAVA